MTRDEIMIAANNKEALPDESSMADKLLWYQMRELLDTFATGVLPKHLASERKIKIANEWSRNKIILENGERAAYRIANMYRDTTIAISDYIKNPSLETADTLVKVIDGVIVKHENTDS